MSEGNAEIVRRAFEAGLRRPKPDFATVNALFHPDHVLESMTSRVEGRDFQGGRGFREWLADMDQTWESWEVRIDRVTEIDDERVLMVTVTSARSKRGISLTQDSGFIVTIRDGRIVRTENPGSVERALEIAGPSE